jgi:hypothetical protein
MPPVQNSVPSGVCYDKPNESARLSPFVTAMPTNPMEYIWPGILVGQAIHAAAKLRIPDLLTCGPKTNR